MGTLKEYEEELKVLETLLAQQRWRRGRRGRWYERRALVLMTHLKDEPGRLDEAMEVVIAGLKDPDTHIGKFGALPPALSLNADRPCFEVFRPMLERRLTRLEKKLRVPPEECHVCEGGLKSATDVYIVGERVRPGGIHLNSGLQVVGGAPPQTQGLAWSNRREPAPKKAKEEVSHRRISVQREFSCAWRGRNPRKVESRSGRGETMKRST